MKLTLLVLFFLGGNLIAVTPKTHDSGLNSEVDTTEPAICSAPSQTVCAHSDAFEKSIETKKNRLVQKALDKAKKSVQAKGLGRYFDLIEKNPKDVKLNTPTEVKDFQKAISLYLEAFREEMRLTNATIDQFVDGSINVSALTIENNPNIPEKIKKSLVARVEETKVSFFERSQTEQIRFLDNDVKPIASTFWKGCGWNGLANSAYNYGLNVPFEITDKTTGVAARREVQLNLIVACPLLFLLMSETGSSLFLNTSLFHELGHSIQSNYYPELYRPIIACFRDEYRKSVGWPKNNLGQPVEVEKFQDELIADFWMGDSLANFLRGAFKTPEQMREAAIKSLVPLCTAKKDADHLDGADRVDLLLRNEQLRRALGCSAPTKNQKACTLTGGVGN